MTSFDASGLNDLPVGALQDLQRVVGDFVVVGKIAIDIVTRGLADLPPDRLTRDVDVAIQVGSEDAFYQRVDGLDGRSGNSFRFQVGGSSVDVLPFGELALDNEVTIRGDHLDVEGMAGARRTALLVQIGDGLTIHVASLAALVVLKLVAWSVRGLRTDNKDAKDLDLLLRASISGTYAEALWQDEEALEHVDFDAHRAGPYRLGREIAQEFEESVKHRLMRILTAESGERLRDILASSTPRSQEQIDALLLGLRSTDAP